MAGDNACSLSNDSRPFLPFVDYEFTRLPIVIPDRVTDTLSDGYVVIPVVVVLHVNHANGIDEAVVKAASRLRKVCRSILNQAVILRGVNDSADDLIAQ